MTEEQKALLWARLETIERLAGASKWRRLQNDQVRYLSATLFHRFFYRYLPGGWMRKTRTFFDQSMLVALPAGTDIFLLGAKTHDSEIRLCRLLLRQLKPADTFIDVGAHYGFYSLFAALLTGPEGRVLALEAAPAAYGLLRVNLGPVTRAMAIQCAVTDREAPVIFQEFPVLFSEYSSLNPELQVSAGSSKMASPRVGTASGRRLDNLLAGLDLHPGFIKIDVEGSEDQVIRGMTALLEDRRSDITIAMEYLASPKKNIAHRKAARLLRAYGFESFSIDKHGSLSPCPDIETSLGQRRLDSDNIIFRQST